MSRREWSELLWAPTLAFVGATALLWAALIAAGLPAEQFLWGSNWVHWDASLYQSMAELGPNLVRCAGTWCGNSGWMPGYPALLAPLYSLGLPVNGTSVAVSWIFDWGTLVLIWGGFLREMRPPIRYAALAFVAVIPGGIFMRAAFPMSMTDFFLVAALILARRGRFAGAGVAGALASFTYLSGAAWAPVLGLLVLLASAERSWTYRLACAAGAAGLVLLGVAAAFLLFWAYTGHVNAYFLVQAKYQHGFHEPFGNLINLIKPLFNGGTGVIAATAAEGLLTTLYVLYLTVLVGIAAVRRTVTGWEIAMLLLVLLLWLFPLTQNGLDYWRGDTLMLGGVLLWNRLRPTGAVLLTTAAAAVFALLAMFYFQGTLS